MATNSPSFPLPELDHPCGPVGREMIERATRRKQREARATIERLRAVAQERMEESEFERELRAR
jgi:hypothetical protein